MHDKNMKKVIIIDDIKSHFIKQAIFVLREDFVSDESHFILDEAYSIINRYIDSCSNSRTSNKRKKSFFKSIFRKRPV